jgi:hypothetical protein
MASKNSSGQTYGKGRTRNYATVVYPDSAPENWREILSQQFIPAFISPLHEKDFNPNGEPKKPHWHVLLMFDSVKTPEQASTVFQSIGGVGCEIVNSLRGYARYLCHLDNPEKAQYEPSEVNALCGADYIASIGLATDKYAAIGEMQDFCDKYDVVSFYALAKYARSNRSDWHRILCDCGSVFMREYLQSRKWSREQNLGDIIDPDTGEVL